MFISKEKYNNLIKELAEKEEKLGYMEHNNLVLLENARQDRATIKDLENNLELVVNNLSVQKRKKLGM